MHLDASAYAALTSGSMAPREARAIATHLARGCQRCERFLARPSLVDPLDGVTDAAIARALPSAAGSGTDAEFDRIERALEGPMSPAAGRSAH